MTVSRNDADVKSASDMIAPARSKPSADLPFMEHCLKSAKVSLAPFAWPIALDLKTQRVVSLKLMGGSLNLSVWPSARQAKGAAVMAAPRGAPPEFARRHGCLTERCCCGQEAGEGGSHDAVFV